jgi:alanine-glyoxylate transaminase/serine-glyoxylate transaminase/serine-pyruvate transaminase
MGTLAGVQMGLRLAGVPHRAGGLDAAMTTLGGDRAPAAAEGSRAVELA